MAKLTFEEVEEWKNSANGKFFIGANPSLSGGMNLNDLLDTIADLERQLIEARAEAAAALEKAISAITEHYNVHVSAGEPKIAQLLRALITEPQASALAQVKAEARRDEAQMWGTRIATLPSSDARESMLLFRAKRLAALEAAAKKDLDDS